MTDTPAQEKAMEFVLVPRAAWELWREECHKPQFLTVGSGAGEPCKVTFIYSGKDALKSAQEMHEALNAIALAALEPIILPSPAQAHSSAGGDWVRERLRDILFTGLVGVDCTTVRTARIMSEGLADDIADLLASAPRPDATQEQRVCVACGWTPRWCGYCGGSLSTSPTPQDTETH